MKRRIIQMAVIHGCCGLVCGLVLWLFSRSYLPFILGWLLYCLLTFMQGRYVCREQEPYTFIRRMWLSEMIKIALFSCVVWITLAASLAIQWLLCGYACAVCVAPFFWLRASRFGMPS